MLSIGSKLYFLLFRRDFNQINDYFVMLCNARGLLGNCAATSEQCDK